MDWSFIGDVEKLTLSLSVSGLVKKRRRYAAGEPRYTMEYRVIHKSLLDFRIRLRNNQDRHGRKEHINR